MCPLTNTWVRIWRVWPQKSLNWSPDSLWVSTLWTIWCWTSSTRETPTSMWLADGSKRMKHLGLRGCRKGASASLNLACTAMLAIHFFLEMGWEGWDVVGWFTVFITRCLRLFPHRPEPSSMICIDSGQPLAEVEMHAKRLIWDIYFRNGRSFTVTAVIETIVLTSRTIHDSGICAMQYESQERTETFLMQRNDSDSAITCRACPSGLVSANMLCVDVFLQSFVLCRHSVVILQSYDHYDRPSNNRSNIARDTIIHDFAKMFWALWCYVML